MTITLGRHAPVPRRAAGTRTVAAVATACALALTVPLGACSAGHTAVSSTASQSGVVIAATAPATSLDFTAVGGAAIPAALMNNVYETLVRINPGSGAVEPGLATSWDVSESSTKYVFRLRDGVKFSNGDDFTAESAAFSINYVKAQWSNGISKQMAPVKTAEATASHELTVTLEHPSNNWLWSMATATGAMMTPSGVADLATRPVGTGPFVVAGFSPSKFVHLGVNPDYWGTPAAQDVTIQYFPDTVSSVNALESGGVDVVWAVQNPELLTNLPDGISKEVGTTNGEVLLSMNNHAAPFTDPRVRQAVAFGIDRHAANDVVWDGLAADTGGAPVPPTDPWTQEKDYYPFDPDRARALMEEAGAVGSKLTITTPTLPYAQTLSELLYSQLEAIGFDVTLESAEFPAVWLSQVMGAKDYQMSLVSHVEPRDIPTLFGNPDYYLGYDNAHVRDLLSQADQAATPQEQTQDMDHAVDAIMADAGALTLMNMPNIVLTRGTVTGLHTDMVTDAIDLRDVVATRDDGNREAGR